jgi:hypothetical protein
MNAGSGVTRQSGGFQTGENPARESGVSDAYAGHATLAGAILTGN